MDDVFAAAERFLRAEARLLEQRLFDTLFHGAPASGVVDALRGYRNADGGFGHGLEPDKRCPAACPSMSRSPCRPSSPPGPPMRSCCAARPTSSPASPSTAPSP
jgi:hypothetical protein